MRRVLAALLALVAGGAAAWLVLGRGDSGGGAEAASARPRPDVAPSRLRIGPTSLFDLATGAPLSVRASGLRGTLRVTVTPAGGRALRLGGPLGIVAGRPAKVAVPAPVSSALARCVPVRLTVAVSRGPTVMARRSRTLAPQPPRCGRFFGPAAAWNQRAEKARLDQWSGALVNDLEAQVEGNFAANFPPTINTVNYSAPVYTVPAGQKRVPVKLVGDRVQWGAAVAAQLAAGVPIPPGARPAWGTDRHMVVWQPATDTMWELWVADDSGGEWTAQWGGRMNGVSRSPGYFYDPSGIQPGATASSLPLVGGLITQADLKRGEINHALAMAIPSSAYAVWTPPAQRTDGNNRSAPAIPAGARFRLDPRVDVDALDVPPFTRMLARAAQRYGIYVRDTSPVVTFYAEDPASIGSDQWAKAIVPSAPEVLRAFPWKDLQVTRMELWTYSNQRIHR
jgi:hypothetical protein